MIKKIHGNYCTCKLCFKPEKFKSVTGTLEEKLIYIRRQKERLLLARKRERDAFDNGII